MNVFERGKGRHQRAGRARFATLKSGRKRRFGPTGVGMPNRPPRFIAPLMKRQQKRLSGHRF